MTKQQQQPTTRRSRTLRPLMRVTSNGVADPAAARRIERRSLVAECARRADETQGILRVSRPFSLWASDAE